MAYDLELKTAINAAKACEKPILSNFFTGLSYEKKSAQELVTKVDFECEKIIKQALAKGFPQYAFVGEETQPKLPDGAFWAVDPLDGTTNFVHGIPGFVVSISLIKNKEPVLGVIFNPIHNQLFQAEKGKGACLNNKKINVSNTNNLEDMVIQFNAGYGYRSLAGKLIGQFGDKIRDPQLGRSTALQTTDLASGRSDAFIKLQANDFDLAAGLLLIKEAGGKITNFQGKDFELFKDKNIIASNGKIHEKLVQEIISMKI